MSKTATNLPNEARAFLDAIAVGESEIVAEQEGIDPYFILVGGGSFVKLPNKEGYNGFPDWAGRKFATGMSHAAGRYQDQPETWRGIVGMFPTGAVLNFRTPGDQDWGNWLLAQHDYKSRTGSELLPKLVAGLVSGMADIMKATWASLSEATFPERYRVALADVLATPTATQIAPPPTPIPVPVPPSPTPTPVTNSYTAVLADLRAQLDSLEARRQQIQAAIDAIENLKEV